MHTKSDAQAIMLLNMKLDMKSLVKGVKPHFTFSYAKGVLFNEDIYELSENEILTMCPDNVWKIFKVPKSNMIVLTFMDSIVPHEIIIENEMIKVRLTDKDLCNVLIVLVLPMFPMFVRGPRSVSFVHSLTKSVCKLQREP